MTDPTSTPRESLAALAVRTVTAADYVETASRLAGVRVFERTADATIVTGRIHELRAYEIAQHSADGRACRVFILRRMADARPLAAHLGLAA